MRLHTKKFLLSFSVIMIFVFYAAFGRKGNGSVNSLPGQLAALGSGIPISSEIPASSPPDPSAGIQTTPVDQPSRSKNTSSRATPVQTPVSTPKPVPAPAPAPAPTQPPGSIYKDGRYIGSSANAYYGDVQVAAVIKGGKLADVQFLDYPRDRNYSVEANNYATPILRSEAIQAQSANVDTVSGATATSEAFIESLGSALEQAKI